MNKSPAAIVKEHFGDKAKLVAALGPLTNDDLWVPRVNDAKGLARVPNAKLLRLFSVLTAVKEKFGNRFKLVDAICDLEKRTKDEGYKKRLLEYPVPRLYDHYRAASNRAGVAIAALPSLASKVPAKGAGDAPKAAKAEAKSSSGTKAAKPVSAKSSAAKGKSGSAKKTKG